MSRTWLTPHWRFGEHAKRGRAGDGRRGDAAVGRAPTEGESSQRVTGQGGAASDGGGGDGSSRRATAAPCAWRRRGAAEQRGRSASRAPGESRRRSRATMLELGRLGGGWVCSVVPHRLGLSGQVKHEPNASTGLWLGWEKYI